VLIDVAKDQLAFAPGIAGVDDGGEALVLEELRDRLQLLGRVACRAEQELLRQHRQSIEAPRLPGGVV